MTYQKTGLGCVSTSKCVEGCLRDVAYGDEVTNSCIDHEITNWLLETAFTWMPQLTMKIADSEGKKELNLRKEID